MTQTENVHPNIRFRITGYRSVAWPEKLSSGRAGHYQHDHDTFPEGSFDHIKAAYPVDSEHAHVPPPPCRYETVLTGPRDMLEERRQLFCRECGRHAGQLIDNRKAVGA